MVAYFVLVSGTFAVYLISYQFRKRNHTLNEKKNYEIIFFFAFFILMLALRASSVGSDTSRYIHLYEEIQKTPFIKVVTSIESELGYRFFEKLLSYVVRSPYIYLGIVAVLTVAPIGYLYYKESELSLLTLSMYMVLPDFHMAFSGLRQMAAMAFTVPIYYAVREKRLLRFFILVGVAYLFHQSAFVLLLLYPIYHLSVKVASLAVVLPTIAFVFLYNSVIYQWIMRFVPERLIERYSDVWDTGGYSVLMLFILLVVLCFFMIRTKNLDKESSGLRNVLILSTILQCFAPINGFAMRINYYFIILVPIAASRLINRADEDKKPFAVVVSIAMTAAFLGLFFYKGFKGQDGFLIFPYQTRFGWLNFG